MPKQKFYENCAVSAALKRSFVDEITAVWWRNKLAATTLNLAKGAAVTEIEVFEIELANGHLNEEVLRQMDRIIPYHLLFVLTFENRAQAWIGYKEASGTGVNAFKVSRYYHTDWMPREAPRFSLAGLTLDKVYENLVRNIHAASQSAPDGRDGLRVVRERGRLGAKTSRFPRTSPATPRGRGWRSRSPRWKSSHGRRSSRRRSLNWYNR